MRQFFRWVMIIGSVIATVYKYRYKALDFVTKVPFLRKLLVRLSMNIPWIRQKFLSQMFRGL
ncbi:MULTISPECIES: hypothetical protein [Halobacillus]|uniref:Sodium:proton antiporter n=1 Tax=Halobacillus faecis TaxID=360184 RepID=A0A511WNJ4_9BACI|nr:MULTISPECIES: hypothetical protein [Halobacillus]MBX0358719.1 hypothetical protein [Halobacillus sp. Nhm2S1]GEN52071.1 hypothetical protein HFA01_03330 [Halobacillus faecis]